MTQLLHLQKTSCLLPPYLRRQVLPSPLVALAGSACPLSQTPSTLLSTTSSVFRFSVACRGFSAVCPPDFCLLIVVFLFPGGLVFCFSFVHPPSSVLYFSFPDIPHCHALKRLVSALGASLAPVGPVLLARCLFWKLQSNVFPLALHSSRLVPLSSSPGVSKAVMAQGERVPFRYTAAVSNCTQIAEGHGSERGGRKMFRLHRHFSVVSTSCLIREGTTSWPACLLCLWWLVCTRWWIDCRPLTFLTVEAAPVWGSHPRSFPLTHFNIPSEGLARHAAGETKGGTTGPRVSPEIRRRSAGLSLYSPAPEQSRAPNRHSTASLVLGRGGGVGSLEYARFLFSLRWWIFPRLPVSWPARCHGRERGTVWRLSSVTTVFCRSQKQSSCLRFRFIKLGAGIRPAAPRYTLVFPGSPAFLPGASGVVKDVAAVLQEQVWVRGDGRGVSGAGPEAGRPLLSRGQLVGGLGHAPVLRQVLGKGYRLLSVSAERSRSAQSTSPVPSLVASRVGKSDRRFAGLDKTLFQCLRMARRSSRASSRQKMATAPPSQSPFVWENRKDVRQPWQENYAETASVLVDNGPCSFSPATGSAWSRGAATGEPPSTSETRKETCRHSSASRKNDPPTPTFRRGCESTPAGHSDIFCLPFTGEESLHKSSALFQDSAQKESFFDSALPQPPGGAACREVEGHGEVEEPSGVETRRSLDSSPARTRQQQEHQHESAVASYGDCEGEHRRLDAFKSVVAHRSTHDSGQSQSNTDGSLPPRCGGGAHGTREQRPTWLSPDRGKHTRSGSASAGSGDNEGDAQWNNAARSEAQSDVTWHPRDEPQKAADSNRRQNVRQVRQTVSSRHDGGRRAHGAAASLLTSNVAALQSEGSHPRSALLGEGAPPYVQVSKVKVAEDATRFVGQPGGQGGADTLHPQQGLNEADRVRPRSLQDLAGVQFRSQAGAERVKEPPKAGDETRRSTACSTRRQVVSDLRRTFWRQGEVFDNERGPQEGAPVTTTSSIQLREAFRSLSRSDVSAFFSFLLNQFPPQPRYHISSEQTSSGVPHPASPSVAKHDNMDSPDYPSSVPLPIPAGQRMGTTPSCILDPAGVFSPPVLEPSTAIHALVCLATYARLQQCEVDLAQGPSFLWNYTHSSAKGAGPRHDVGDSSVSSFGSPPPFAAPVSSLNVDEERKSLGGEKAEGIRKASSEGARQRKHVAGRASSSSNRKGGSQQAHFGLVEEGQENFYFQVTGTGPPCSPGSKERLPLVVIERLMEAVGENLSSAQAADLSTLLSALVSLSTAIRLPHSASSSKLVAPLSSLPAPPARLVRFAGRMSRLVVLVLKQLVIVLDQLNSPEIFQSLNALISVRRELHPSSVSSVRCDSSLYGSWSPVGYGLAGRSSSKHRTGDYPEEVFDAYKSHEDRVSRGFPGASSTRWGGSLKRRFTRGTNGWRGSRGGSRGEEAGSMLPLLFLPLPEGEDDQRENADSGAKPGGCFASGACSLPPQAGHGSTSSSEGGGERPAPRVSAHDAADMHRNEKRAPESASGQSGADAEGKEAMVNEHAFSRHRSPLVAPSVQLPDDSSLLSLEEETQHIPGAPLAQGETDVLIALVKRICYPPTTSPRFLEAAANFIGKLMHLASESLSAAVDDVMSGNASPVSGKRLTTSRSEASCRSRTAEQQRIGVNLYKALDAEPGCAHGSETCTTEKGPEVGGAGVGGKGARTRENDLRSETEDGAFNSEVAVKLGEAVALWSNERLSNAARSLLVTGEAWIPVMESLDSVFGESLGASFSFRQFVNAVVLQQMLLFFFLAEYQRRTRVCPQRGVGHEGTANLADHRTESRRGKKLGDSHRGNARQDSAGEAAEFPWVLDEAREKRIGTPPPTKSQSRFWRSLESRLLGRTLLSILMITARVPHSVQSLQHLAGLQYALQALHTEETEQGKAPEDERNEEQYDRTACQLYRSKRASPQDQGEKATNESVSPTHRSSSERRLHSVKARKTDLLEVLLSDDEAEVDTRAVLASSKLLLSALTAAVATTGAGEEGVIRMEAGEEDQRTKRTLGKKGEEVTQIAELYCSLAAMKDPGRLCPSPALTLLARKLQRELSQSSLRYRQVKLEGVSLSTADPGAGRRGTAGVNSVSRKGSTSDRLHSAQAVFSSKNYGGDGGAQREALNGEKTFLSLPPTKVISFDLLQRLLISADRCGNPNLLELVLCEMTSRLAAQTCLIAEKNARARQDALASIFSTNQIDLAGRSAAETASASTLKRGPNCSADTRPHASRTTDSERVSTALAQQDATRSTFEPATGKPGCSGAAALEGREQTLAAGKCSIPAVQGGKSRPEAGIEEFYGHGGDDPEAETIAKHVVLAGKALTALGKWVGPSEPERAAMDGDASRLPGDQAFSMGHGKVDKERRGTRQLDGRAREGLRFEQDPHHEAVEERSPSLGEELRYASSNSGTRSASTVASPLPSTHTSVGAGGSSKTFRYPTNAGKHVELFVGEKGDKTLKEGRNLQDACLSFAMAVTEWAGAVRFQGCASTDVALLTHALVPLWRKILGLMPTSKSSLVLKHSEPQQQTVSQLRHSLGVEGWPVRPPEFGGNESTFSRSRSQPGPTEGEQREDHETRENSRPELEVGRSCGRLSWTTESAPSAIQKYFAVLSEALGYAPCPRLRLPLTRSVFSSALTAKRRDVSQSAGSRGLLSSWKPSLICLLLHCLIRVTPGLTPPISMLPSATNPETSSFDPYQTSAASPPAESARSRTPYANEGLGKRKVARACDLPEDVPAKSFVVSEAKKPRVADEDSPFSFAGQGTGARGAHVEGIPSARLCAQHHRWMLTNFPHLIRPGPCPSDSPFAPREKASSTHPRCSVSTLATTAFLCEPATEPWPVSLMHAAVEELQASVRFPRDVVAASAATASALSALRAVYGAERLERSQRDCPDVDTKYAGEKASQGSETVNRFPVPRDQHAETGDPSSPKKLETPRSLQRDADKQHAEAGRRWRGVAVTSLCSSSGTSAQANCVDRLDAGDRDRENADTADCLVCSMKHTESVSEQVSLAAPPSEACRVSSRLSHTAESKICPKLQESPTKVNDKPRPTMFVNGLSFREVGSVIWGLDRASTHNHHALFGVVKELTQDSDSPAGPWKDRPFFSCFHSSLGVSETCRGKGNVSTHFLGSVWSGEGVDEESARLCTEERLRHLQLTQGQWLPLGASLALEHLRRAGGFCHKLSLYFSGCIRSVHRRLVLDSLASPVTSLHLLKLQKNGLPGSPPSRSQLVKAKKASASTSEASPTQLHQTAGSSITSTATVPGQFAGGPKTSAPPINPLQQRRQERDVTPSPQDLLERVLPGRIRDLAGHLFIHQEKPFPSSASLARVARWPPAGASEAHESFPHTAASVRRQQLKECEPESRATAKMQQQGASCVGETFPQGSLTGTTSEGKGELLADTNVEGAASGASAEKIEEVATMPEEISQVLADGHPTLVQNKLHLRLEEKQKPQQSASAAIREYETTFQLRGQDGNFFSAEDEKDSVKYLDIKKRQLEEAVWRPFRGCVDWRDLPQNDSWLSPPGVTVSLLLTSFVSKFSPGFFDLVAAVVECPMHLLDFGLSQLQHTLQPLASLSDAPVPPSSYASSSASSRSSGRPPLSPPSAADQEQRGARPHAAGMISDIETQDSTGPRSGSPSLNDGGLYALNHSCHEDQPARSRVQGPLPRRLVVTPAFLRAATLALLRHAALLSVGVSFQKGEERGLNNESADRQDNSRTSPLERKERRVPVGEGAGGGRGHSKDGRRSENEQRVHGRADAGDTHKRTGSKTHEAQTTSTHTIGTTPGWILSKLVSLLSSTRALAVLLDTHMHYWRAYAKEEMTTCSLSDTPPQRQPSQSEHHLGDCRAQAPSVGYQAREEEETGTHGDRGSEPQAPSGNVLRRSQRSSEGPVSRASRESREDVFSVFPKSFEHELQTLLSFLSILLTSKSLLPSVSASASLVASAADIWSLVGRWMALGQESKEALQALAPAAIHLLLHTGTEKETKRRPCPNVPDVLEMVHAGSSRDGGSWGGAGGNGGHKKQVSEGREGPWRAHEREWQASRGAAALTEEGENASDEEKGREIQEEAAGFFYRGIVNMRKKLEARDKEEESLKQLAAAVHRLRAIASISPAS